MFARNRKWTQTNEKNPGVSQEATKAVGPCLRRAAQGVSSYQGKGLSTSWLLFERRRMRMPGATSSALRGCLMGVHHTEADKQGGP